MDSLWTSTLSYATKSGILKIYLKYRLLIDNKKMYLLKQQSDEVIEDPLGKNYIT